MRHERQIAATSGQHVVANTRGGWSVRRTGSQRATKVFDNEDDAIRFAREKAREARGDLYVHRRDGTVRERDTYADHRQPRER
jgi:hypothetical protein